MLLLPIVELAVAVCHGWLPSLPVIVVCHGGYYLSVSTLVAVHYQLMLTDLVSYRHCRSVGLSLWLLVRHQLLLVGPSLLSLASRLWVGHHCLSCSCQRVM